MVDVSTLSKASERMDDAVELLMRGVEALALAAVVVGLACLVILMSAFTFGVLHNGDDFDFGGGRGGGGGDADVIVLPASPF